ncbi:MAG: hypothetical protein SNJ82_02040 [Gemmataceae bacterium]
MAKKSSAGRKKSTTATAESAYSLPSVTGPLRAVTITGPTNGANIPPGSLTVQLFAVPAVQTDKLIVTAYPLPSCPPGTPIVANPVTPLPAAQAYNATLSLAPHTSYMITATLVDHAGLQHDVAVIRVNVGP